MMFSLWLIFGINAIWHFPAPYYQLTVLLFQVTVIGHIACCAGFRLRQGKPVPWLGYQDILLFGVFAIMAWNWQSKQQPESNSE